VPALSAGRAAVLEGQLLVKGRGNCSGLRLFRYSASDINVKEQAGAMVSLWITVQKVISAPSSRWLDGKPISSPLLANFNDCVQMLPQAISAQPRYAANPCQIT